MCSKIIVTLIVDLNTKDRSEALSMNWHINWMDWIGPCDVVGHQQGLLGVQDNYQLSMGTTIVSRGNAARIVVELLLEHL
jgi:hypothetical protein